MFHPPMSPTTTRRKTPGSWRPHGGVEVLLEQDCSGQALFQAACGILHDGAEPGLHGAGHVALGISGRHRSVNLSTVLEISKKPVTTKPRRP